MSEAETVRGCLFCGGEPHERRVGDESWTHCFDCGLCLEGEELVDVEV